MLKLFTFGYWGWGNSTHELIRAIDSAESKKGFSPPIFCDIRLRRSVRAEGFRDGAFERLLPNGRYHWFPSLGNINIATKERGIKIKEPLSARLLFQEALKDAEKNRRIIFFCACEFPNWPTKVLARLREAQIIDERTEKKLLTVIGLRNDLSHHELPTVFPPSTRTLSSVAGLINTLFDSLLGAS